MSTRFIGRSAELDRVAALLDRVRDGRAGGLFVVGEPGVGKSRLISEAERMAAERSVRVGHAAWFALTTPLPLDPVLELLRLVGQPLGLMAGDSQGEVFWTAVEQLQHASVPGPLLLCIDDLHWSDAASIDFVHYCLARLSDLPIAWLLAARSGQSQSRVMHRLERQGLVAGLELSPLSWPETRLLAEAVLGTSDVSDEVIAQLYERTDGNPFFCVELLGGPSRGDADARPLAARGSLVLDALVPATVTDAIADRADRLSPAARAALDWAAVLPEPFGFEQLDAAGGAGRGRD